MPDQHNTPRAEGMQERLVFIPTLDALSEFHAPPRPPAPDATLYEFAGETMGTSWQVKAYLNLACPPSYIESGIAQVLALVVQEMSPWENNSDLCKFNRAPVGSTYSLPAAFSEVMACALRLAQQTHAAYNPCIAKLTQLWGFGPAGKITVLPSPDQISTAKKESDWTALQFDVSTKTLIRNAPVEIDLCSIAKGYAVDLVADFLLKEKLTSFLVEVGGELKAHGIKADCQAWWVECEGIPEQSKTNNIVALIDHAIASSGDYRRYTELNGKNYSHTIDPRTGLPIQHGLACVTVIHRQCMWADALATAFCVMGLEEGMAFANQYAYAAQFIQRTEHGVSEHYSQALATMLDV